MQLDAHTERDIDILELHGEVDMANARTLRRLLKGKAKSKCRALLLDVSRLSFIDSTGLAAIIEYLRDSTQFGGRFCIGGAGEQLRAIFEVVRLDKAMPIFADSAKAKEALAYNCLPKASKPLFVSAP